MKPRSQLVNCLIVKIVRTGQWENLEKWLRTRKETDRFQDLPPPPSPPPPCEDRKEAMSWVECWFEAVDKFTYSRPSSSPWIFAILGHPILKPTGMHFVFYLSIMKTCFNCFLGFKNCRGLVKFRPAVHVCSSVSSPSPGGFWQSREHLLRTEQKRQDDFGCFFSASRASVYLSVFAKLALASGYSFFILGSGCVWPGHAGAKLLVLHLLPSRMSCAYGCTLPARQLGKQACDGEPWCLSGPDSSDERSELDRESEVCAFPKPGDGDARPGVSWRW